MEKDNENTIVYEARNIGSVGDIMEIDDEKVDKCDKENRKEVGGKFVAQYTEKTKVGGNNVDDYSYFYSHSVSQEFNSQNSENGETQLVDLKF
ncbi:conserved hypothetical protein [Ricinus communis]|uniref:Uncharacterized protein n=1 Tax=Ricinus communis TaxID=3988 RepID=B9SY09_RICCO|nr:conserved hypothetical protein [Ricinus communis]